MVITNKILRNKMMDIYDLWTPDVAAAPDSNHLVLLRFFETSQAAHIATSLDRGAYELVVSDVFNIKRNAAGSVRVQEFISAYINKNAMHVDLSVDRLILTLGPKAEVFIKSSDIFRNEDDLRATDNP